MAKIPYKYKQSSDGEEDEIVSFEAFCGGEARGGDIGELNLNDNVNYRLHYERGDSAAAPGTAATPPAHEKETWLGGTRPAGRKRASALARGVRGGSAYRRFSDRPEADSGCTSFWQSVRWGAVAVLLVVAGGAGVWWGVGRALGDAWSEQHYRRLWQRTHPAHQDLAAANYHDHNNLSIHNRQNGSETSRKKGCGDPCSSVTDDLRFDCHPQDGASEAACRLRGCCWRPKDKKAQSADEIGLPSCFYPTDYQSYKFVNMTETKRGLTAYYDLVRPSTYPDDFRVAKIQIFYLTDDTLHVKITDGERSRFEPPVPPLGGADAASGAGEGAAAAHYRVILEPQQTGFRILRQADNVTILDTRGAGGLVLSGRLLQLSARLSTHELFGLGERRGPLRLDTRWRRHTLFNHDTPPLENTNLYGSHPFYLALEESGKSHGVLLFNSNPMDVVLQPAPAVTWRATGGVLQLLVLLGPAPRDVIAQYTALVGRPAMPPYWALGFHLCKFNYGSLNETREVWRRTRDAGIPFDVQWNDLDYMSEGRDFTVDEQRFAGLAAFVDELHAAGMHYVPLIDPGVSASEAAGSYPPYDVGRDLDVFIKDKDGAPFVGKVWNKVSTVWPDFTHPNATAYWLAMLRSLHDQIHFDGLWIDMNEPSNFLSGPLNGSCAPNAAPFTPHVAGGVLHAHTLCMDAHHHLGPHENLHNLHALTEAIATHFALTEIRGKRPFVLSRASSPGLGRYAGHWSGDVASTWHDMRSSIPELLSFSLFGVPLMGADICGFRGDASPELCLRWMQLGAFYPFSRNHNSDTSKPQDPVALGPEVTRASVAALRLRYTLLPYLYTLFWRAHASGHTVATPLFFEFPLDPTTHALETQFLLGRAVLVAPVLEEGAALARVYLPRQLWYALNGTRLVPFAGWGWLHDNETVLVRGGSVLPLQRPPPGAASTRATRSRPLELLVAPDDEGRAAGELYWDDGDQLDAWEQQQYSWTEFSAAPGLLEGRARRWAEAQGARPPPVGAVLVPGQAPVRAVLLDGRATAFVYTPSDRLLAVRNLSLSLAEDFRLEWQ